MSARRRKRDKQAVLNAPAAKAQAARASKPARPPFTAQFDHASRQALLEKRVEELGRLASTPRALAATRDVCEDALEIRPDHAEAQANLEKAPGARHTVSAGR
jgi:hypothetical protein